MQNKNKRMHKNQKHLSWTTLVPVFTSLCKSKVVSIRDVPSMLFISSCSSRATFCSTSCHNDSGGVYVQGSPEENAIVVTTPNYRVWKNHFSYRYIVSTCTRIHYIIYNIHILCTHKNVCTRSDSKTETNQITYIVIMNTKCNIPILILVILIAILILIVILLQ